MPRAEQQDLQLGTPLVGSGDGSGGARAVRQSRGCRLAAAGLMGLGVIVFIGVGLHSTPRYESSVSTGAAPARAKPDWPVPDIHRVEGTAP